MSKGIKDENNKKKLHNKYRNSSQNNNGNNQVTITKQNRIYNSDKQNEINKEENKIVESKLFIEGTVMGSINNEKIKVSSDCLKEDNFKFLQSYAAFPKHNDEWNELAQVILTDIYLENPNVKWENIVGLNSAKNLIKEAVVYPIKYPELFSGLLSPWKGLLLFGPPGTGKTMLAKAVATECQTTFFNISAATIISKWRGDSEKLIRVLFELARIYAPSTIFLDEIDSLMGQRVSQSGNEHEASRRMKTELMIQMDGLARSDHLVFVLAASNIPWELDHAILRRLEKRILVSLPNREIRIALFQQFLPPTVVQNKIICVESNLDYYCLADETDGYSGADIKLVCKETVMNCIRKIFNLLENHIQGRELSSVSVEPIKTTDVLLAISRTKPSARNFADKYNSWQEEFGAN
ncbi:katanin p60 ATPase-containing subunit A-like 2 isoform X2 [Centruroides vittatus]|uniref:katanin p60 ATPase-containing subunit A-like 2 isoform X2 n=1 Tax=Centruroides vittatus TaxID=120091 RepID=UPI003510B3A9